jgi:hypothetical protein
MNYFVKQVYTRSFVDRLSKNRLQGLIKCGRIDVAHAKLTESSTRPLLP